MGEGNLYLGGRREVIGIKERPIEPRFTFVETKGKQKIKVFANKPKRWYDTLVSVEHKTDKPFERTIIQEYDSITKRQRETCLIAQLNEINSEVSGMCSIFAA